MPPKRRKSTASRGTLVPASAKIYRCLAAEWLRYDHGCYLVAMERSPWTTKALPDVLGLDAKRSLIEVEIKVSRSDFLADAAKPHRRNLLNNIVGRMPTAPQYLYYLVPPALVDCVREHAPELAGILTPSDSQFSPHSGLPLLQMVRPATRLHGFKLPIKQCHIMARDMAGTLSSLARDYAKEFAIARGADCVREPEADVVDARDTYRQHERTPPAVAPEPRGKGFVAPVRFREEPQQAATEFRLPAMPVMPERPQGAETQAIPAPQVAPRTAPGPLFVMGGASSFVAPEPLVKPASPPATL